MNDGEAGLPILVLTGRTIDQGTWKEHGKLSDSYMENVAVCFIDPDDMKALNVKENANVLVENEFGSAVVYARTSKRAPHPRVVFMPYGPWASLVMDPDTDGTGMPSLKGIPASLKVTCKPVQTVVELIKKNFRR